jgi:hypothetical protein
VQQIAESSIRSQRIDGRPQKNGGVESRLAGLVQPGHRLVLITDYLIDQGDVEVESGIDDQGPGLKAVDLPKFHDAFVRLTHHHQMPRIPKMQRRIDRL